MTGTRIAALILLVAGFLALAYQGFSYTKREKVVDIGPVEVTADKKKHVSLPPIVGGAAIVVGIALLFADRRGHAV